MYVVMYHIYSPFLNSVMWATIDRKAREEQYLNLVVVRLNTKSVGLSVSESSNRWERPPQIVESFVREGREALLLEFRACSLFSD